ncbi:MAG TPA: DNRLRE domain-containing protein, partial [Gaiellaceae bacterium]|nr:DNRLRE domain-containing protein [Gaiellaceae bacterium]
VMQRAISRFIRVLRPRRLVALAAAAAVLGTGVAFAASLGVSSGDLTTYTVATTVPISSCTVTASGDTYADQSTLNAGGNFGTNTTMLVESSQALGLGTNKRSFVKFDLSSCSIPASAQIVSSTLNLYLSTAPTAARTYDAYRVTASWAETSLTWNNQPSVAASATSSIGTGTTSGTTLSWNVASDVQSFVSGSATNNGWLIRDSSESSSTTRRGTFATRETGTASQRPSLAITYYR